MQIALHSQAPQGGTQSVSLDVENRYDFRSLSGITLLWSFQVNGAVQQSGATPLKAVSHAQELVSVGFPLPATVSNGAVFALDVRCIDEAGQEINRRTFPIDRPNTGDLAAQLANAPAPATEATAVSEAGSDLRIVHPQFEIRADRQTGAISIRTRQGRILAEGPFPHVGRKYTMAEELRAKPNPLSLWQGNYLSSATDVRVETATTPAGVTLTVHARYARPGAADQAIEGESSLLITPRGAIHVTYNYAPVKATGVFLEAGVSLVVPQAPEFHWIGQGPYPGYPGKDLLTEFGIHHLNRDDLNFQGNRRQVDVALLSDLAGSGIALAGEHLDVAVENTADGSVILSQNALISSRGNKGSNPEAPVNSANVKQISGKFTLLPLASGSAWPGLLTQWFGRPSEGATAFQPFFQSYDQ